MQHHSIEETIVFPLTPVENEVQTGEARTTEIQSTGTETQCAPATAEQSVRQTALVEQMRVGLSHEVRSLRRRSIRYGIAVALFIPFMQIFAAISGILTPLQQNEMILVIFASVASMAFYTIFYFLRTGGQQRLKGIAKIAAMEDVRLVGPLSDILAIGSPLEHTMAKETLTRLLPKLKASDAALLSHAQRRQLDRCLMLRLYNKSKIEQQRDTDFQLAILAGYEQTGDIDSRSAVWALAYPTPEYERSVPPEVVAAARRCLQFLEYQAAQQLWSIEQYRISSQLLRPSSASEVSREMLLRPAMPQTNPQEAASLLRAAASVDAPATLKAREEK